MADKENPFVLAQLEEALEERQNPDRRKKDKSLPKGEDRRRGSRREKDTRSASR